MTTLDHATQPMMEASRPVLLARVVQWALAYARAVKNRREIYRLGAMSDLELSDIGLTRTDLHIAVRSPFGVDPTACLGAFAADRAKARENAVRRVC